MASRRPENTLRVSPSPLMADLRDDLTVIRSKQPHLVAPFKMPLNRGDRTLHVNDLVHAAYLQLRNASSAMWQNQTRVLVTVVKVMRQRFVDSLRAHRAVGRRGRRLPVAIPGDMVASTPIPAVFVLGLDQALTRLAEFDRRQVPIIGMHLCAGLISK